MAGPPSSWGKDSGPGSTRRLWPRAPAMGLRHGGPTNASTGDSSSSPSRGCAVRHCNRQGGCTSPGLPRARIAGRLARGPGGRQPLWLPLALHIGKARPSGHGTLGFFLLLPRKAVSGRTAGHFGPGKQPRHRTGPPPAPGRPRGRRRPGPATFLASAGLPTGQRGRYLVGIEMELRFPGLLAA